MTDIKEIKADIRNKLTLPLTLIEAVLAGEKPSKKLLELSRENIKAIVRLIDRF